MKVTKKDNSIRLEFPSGFDTSRNLLEQQFFLHIFRLDGAIFAIP